jgi:hypothetical protein
LTKRARRDTLTSMRRFVAVAFACLASIACGGNGANDSTDVPGANDGDVATSDVVNDSAQHVDSMSDASIDAPLDTPSTEDAGAPTTALLRPSDPMPCADPGVVSDKGASKTFFVYCTSMSHVWSTTDWVHFTDVRSSVTFDIAAMSANGKKMGAWWAPGVVYSASLDRYVMWVSVPDSQGTEVVDGWDTRSLAVLTAPAADGPWTFQGLAIDAATVGEHYIDPFPFIDADGKAYAFWKQYGGGISSSIMGASIDATLTSIVGGSAMEVMNGFGGPGTWEDNVRENPAVVRDAGGRYHMIFSGGHWADDTYATGHALSTCGPLCPATSSGGWHMVDSSDRGVLQVVRALGNPSFANGGPGGAVFLDDTATAIVYAAAAKSASGDKTRYLMRDDVKWLNHAPFVDTPGHEPLGF